MSDHKRLLCVCQDQIAMTEADRSETATRLLIVFSLCRLLIGALVRRNGQRIVLAVRPSRMRASARAQW